MIHVESDTKMSDIFLPEDASALLDNRFIVIIGDSIQRAVYKDLVLLLQKSMYLTENELRAKGELTFYGDKLIEGGQYSEMTNGVNYREVRQYQTDYHLIRFYFVTRCYNSYVESILTDLSKEPLPDAVVMNSCLWDITRYGPTSVDEYKENLEKLMKRFKEVLPKSCLVVWNMTLPISKNARGGVLIPEIEFMKSTLRLDILEANFFIHKLAKIYGYNTLDLHYFLRYHLQRRAGDGVHWDMTAHRRITNLLLTHIAQAWDVQSPQHAQKYLQQRPLLEQSRFPLLVSNESLNAIYPQHTSNLRQFSSQPAQVLNFGINRFSNLNSNYNTVPTDVQMRNRPAYLGGQQSSGWQNDMFRRNQNENMGYDQQMLEQQMPVRRYGTLMNPTDFRSALVNTNTINNMHQLNWQQYDNRDYIPSIRRRTLQRVKEHITPYHQKY